MPIVRQKRRKDRQIEAPEELKLLPIWLLWRVEVRDGKTVKVPHYANGVKRGKTDTDKDRSQLVLFDAAVKACDRTLYRGIAVALGAMGDGRILSGIDLDDCMENGKPHAKAQKVIDAANSYTEVSPSGEGIHILGWGNIGTKGSDGTGLEIYSGGRYFTFTGRRL